MNFTTTQLQFLIKLLITSDLEGGISQEELPIVTEILKILINCNKDVAEKTIAQLEYIPNSIDKLIETTTNEQNKSEIYKDEETTGFNKIKSKKLLFYKIFPQLLTKDLMPIDNPAPVWYD